MLRQRDVGTVRMHVPRIGEEKLMARYTVTFTFESTGIIEVEAESEDDAAEKIKSMDFRQVTYLLAKELIKEVELA